MLEWLASAEQFLIPFAEIVGINIVLSGDNAVVIALASRDLPPKQQKQAVLWGAGAAIVMRIVLTLSAVALLSLPYLKLLGSLVVLWIGLQLLKVREGDSERDNAVQPSSHLYAAIRTILAADLVMSLDNVLGVAAVAANRSPLLLVMGLAVSIPLVIFGANLLLRLMQRFPVIITLGAALLGYVGGEMAVTDPVLKDWIVANFRALSDLVPIAGALLVLLVGKFVHASKAAAR